MNVSTKQIIVATIHAILGSKYAEEVPPKINTDNWPSPQDHTLTRIQQTFAIAKHKDDNIEEYINIKQCTRPKYMFDSEKIIAIDDTIEYKKQYQYLASLSVAILFLHKLRDIPAQPQLILLWNNIITIIIYLIDHGSNINESFVFHERCLPNTAPRPDWILYTPLHLIHLLLSYTNTKYNNNPSMSFKHISITNLYHYLIRNCCNSLQLPSMYNIRIYVDPNGEYQKGFDHRFFGNVFKKIPSKQEINNLLLRGIQPFTLCIRIKENDFLLNQRKERVITLNEMKAISGKYYNLFSVPIYIYALVQQFTSIHHDLLLVLKQFNTVYAIFDDIWKCVLSFMYQDVMDFCAPKMDFIELKTSIITNISHVKVFQDEGDYEFWFLDVLKDEHIIREMDTHKLCVALNALMDNKLWKCIQHLFLVITQKKGFVEYIETHPAIAMELLSKCCHLTLYSTHFIDMFYEILKHCNSFRESIYYAKLKFTKFIRYSFYHLNKMEQDGIDDETDVHDDDDDDDDDDEVTDDDEDWNMEDISVEDEDMNVLRYYVNHMRREEIVDKTVFICERMYDLDAFKPNKKMGLLMDVLSNAQSQGCVEIIKVLVRNSWDINAVINGHKFGWSLAVCAEYPVHDEVLEYIFSLHPKINEEWKGMFLFLYLIQMRMDHLDEQHLMKFCEYLRIYAKEHEMNDMLLEIMTQKMHMDIGSAQVDNVVSLFQGYLKYPNFSEYLDRLTQTLHGIIN